MVSNVVKTTLQGFRIKYSRGIYVCRGRRGFSRYSERNRVVIYVLNIIMMENKV